MFKKIILFFFIVVHSLDVSYIICQDNKEHPKPETLPIHDKPTSWVEGHYKFNIIQDTKPNNTDKKSIRKKDTTKRKHNKEPKKEKGTSIFKKALGIAGLVGIITGSNYLFKQRKRHQHSHLDTSKNISKSIEAKKQDPIQLQPRFKGSSQEWVKILQTEVAKCTNMSLYDQAFLFYQSIESGYKDGVSTLLPLLLKRPKEDLELIKLYYTEMRQKIPHLDTNDLRIFPTTIIQFYKGKDQEDATAIKSAINGSGNNFQASYEMLDVLISHDIPVTSHDIEYALYRKQPHNVITLLSEAYAPEKKEADKKGKNTQKAWATPMMLALALAHERKDQGNVVQLLLDGKADPCQIISTSEYQHIKAPIIPYELLLDSKDQKINELLKPYADTAQPIITQLDQQRQVKRTSPAHLKK